MRRSLSMFCLVTLLLLLFSGCANQVKPNMVGTLPGHGGQPSLPDSEDSALSISPNQQIQANRMNKGLVASDGEWLYLSNMQDDWRLYRCRADGSELQKLDDWPSLNISVAGGYVYYLQSPYPEFPGPTRIRTSDGLKQAMDERVSYWVLVRDDGFYYGERSDSSDAYSDCHLYWMKANGTERMRVVEPLVGYSWVGDNYVLFTDDENHLQVQRGSHDPEEIVSSFVAPFLVIDCWIYYVDRDAPSSVVYRVSLDGSSRQLISQLDASYLNWCEGWIVFSNNSDGRKLYKMRADGSDVTKLSDLEAMDLNVVDDAVFFDHWGHLYTIRIDGSGLKEFPGDK